MYPNTQEVIQLLRTWSYRRDPTAEELRVFDVEHLIKVLSDIIKSDNAMRYYATNALIRLDTRRGVGILLPILDDPQTDDEMRYQICGLMSSFGDERAVKPLLQRLLHDSTGNVRAVAAFALGEIGNEEVIPSLRWALEHDQGADFQGTPMKIIAQEAIDEILNRQ